MGAGVVSCAAMHATGKAGEAQLISNAALRGREQSATHGPLGQLSYAKISPSRRSSACLPACLPHQAALLRSEKHPHSAPEVFPMAEKKAKLNRGNYAHELRWTIKSQIAKENEQKSERGK